MFDEEYSEDRSEGNQQEAAHNRNKTTKQNKTENNKKTWVEGSNWGPRAQPRKCFNDRATSSTLVPSYGFLCGLIVWPCVC